jgi:hypothetical protein
MTVLHQTARSFVDRHALDSTVEQTKQLIHLLDVDNDGKVSREEVDTFATANGLDPRSISDEFAGVDTNANGILEQEEIALLLNSSPDQAGNVPATAAIDTVKPVAQAGNAPITAAMPIHYRSTDQPVAQARTRVRFDASPPSTPLLETATRTPLLKAPSAASFAATQSQPTKSNEPSPEGDVEEYYAQVPVATMQEKDATRSAQRNMANDAESKVDASAVKKGQSGNTDTDTLSPEANIVGSNSTTEMLLHQGAGKSVAPAISATQKMAEQLNSEVAQTAQSMTFSAAASTLRANATAVLLHAQLEARAAAQKAANEVTMNNLKEINKLQSRAAKAEMRAAALRARANVEMKEAYAAVAVASSSMAKIRAKKTAASKTTAQ